MDKLIISENDFKTIAPVSDNILISSPYTQIIRDAQIRYIKPILCDDVYDALQAQLPTPNATYQALVDKIKPCLAWYGLYVAIPYFSFKIREAGVAQFTGDRTQQMDITYITYLRADSLSAAEMHAIELRKFLRDNSTDYPLCDPDCDGVSSVSLKNNIYFMNI